jgi:Hydantoinase/oxoprolinase N-terminal region
MGETRQRKRDMMRPIKVGISEGAGTEASRSPTPQPAPSQGWRFAIDRGGTFTDLVGRSPEGRLVVRKVLSVQPQQPGDPAIRALKEVLQLEPDQPLPPGLVQEVRLGTTVATNALLERQLEPVLLLLNSGFADLPLIGDQHRPDIFALRIERPEPLPMRVMATTVLPLPCCTATASQSMSWPSATGLSSWALRRCCCRISSAASPGSCPGWRPPWWRRRSAPPCSATWTRWAKPWEPRRDCG